MKMTLRNTLATLLSIAALGMFTLPAAAQDDGQAFRGITAGFAESPVESESPFGINELAKQVRRGVVTVRSIDIRQGMPGSAFGGAVGSGFIIDKQGHVITNYHVAGTAGQARVTLWDDTDLPAQLVHTDPGVDIALLKIKPPRDRSQGWLRDKLHPIPMGDSDEISLGESVITFGNPGWSGIASSNMSEIADNWYLKQTVNLGEMAGRIDAVDFQISVHSRYMVRGNLGFQYGTNLVRPIRMSATINGGNSGGPLIDAEGNVVGINSWGGELARVAESRNSAVPINEAKEFALQVIETGSFARPWTGLDVLAPKQYLNRLRYSEFVDRHRPDDRLPIYGIRANSPADEAGFRKGDVILEIDGLQFPGPEAVRAYVLSRDVGEELEFLINRDGQEQTITVETTEKPTYNSDFSV